MLQRPVHRRAGTKGPLNAGILGRAPPSRAEPPACRSRGDIEDADRSEVHLQVRLLLLRVEAAWKEGNGPMSSQAPELHLLVRFRMKHGVDGKEARALMSNNLAELPLLVPLPVKCRANDKEGRVPTPNPAALRAVNLLLRLDMGKGNLRAARKRARNLLRVLALDNINLI